MSVTLTGTSSGNQGLFNRLGAIGGVLTTINTFRGGAGAGDLTAQVEDVLELFDGANPTLRGTVETLQLTYLTNTRNALATAVAALKTAAQRVLIEMFDADAPLTTRTVETALLRLRAQMVADGAYVDANTVSATVTQTSLAGTGVVTASPLDGRGRPLENALAETARITVTRNTTAGAETLRIAGEAAAASRLDHDWPLGSGAARNYTSLAATSSSNKISNGAFETFTVANTPDNFTIAVGSAGTHVLSEATTVHAGSKALELVGNGSTLTKLTQTLTGLLAHTPYAVNCWIKADVVPAAGVLQLDLFDGSAVIQDEAGNECKLVIDCTLITTSFVAKTAWWRLPDPLPATVQLRIHQTTAVSSGSSIFLDTLALQAGAQLDTANPGATPFVAVFSGAANWSLDDGALDGATTFKLVTANDRASLWQQLFDQLFDASTLGFTLPTSGSTLINDSLIA